jgi:predicted O-methyltransferase YrrM
MPTELEPAQPIEGQLNPRERELLTNAILEARAPVKVAVEVGTWLGGGSTLHILRALEKRGEGHLWGIEAVREIYERMLANLRAGAPEAQHRFTPLFGFSQEVIPGWLADQPPDFKIDLAFLDGGNNPMEQVIEFRLLEPHIPVGGQLMAHDAKLRKGKFLIPYLSRLDNWRIQLHDVSQEGLLYARKTASQASSQSLQAARAALLKSRLRPIEIIAAILPSQLCGFICRVLPTGIFMRLYSGAKLEKQSAQPQSAPR